MMRMRGLAAAAVACWSLAASSACAAAAGSRSVANDRLWVAFAEDGTVASLRDIRADRDLAATNRAPLFRLELAEGTATNAVRLTLQSSDARSVEWIRRSGVAGVTSAGLVFHDLGGRGISATCAVTAVRGDPFIRLGMGLGLPAPLVLEAAVFPIVKLRSSDSPDEAALLGASKGGLTRRPSAMKAGQSITATQPGDLAAQFGGWYDGTSGFVTAALDETGLRKTAAFTRTADGLQCSWRHPAWAKGAWSMGFDVGWSVFPGTIDGRKADWRDAADLYKEWASKRPWCARTLARRDDLPAWIRQGPAMVRFNRDALADPGRIARWLDGVWRTEFPTGTPLIVALWGWEKVGTWITPDYFPPYPSEEGFAQIVRSIRAAGGHAFAWPSGYHYTLTYDRGADGRFAWDDRVRFDAEARRHAVVGRSGAVAIRTPSWLRGGDTATMCGGDPWTIDWFNRTGSELARRGVEMVQVDQVVGANVQDCYSDAHGHAPGPGSWQSQGFHRQMRTLLEQCRKHEAGAVVGFEEPNEHFLQEAGIQDYRDTETPREPASVFNYLYHEYLATFQSNPRANSLEKAAWCMANGQIPHMVPAQSESGPALDGGGFEGWTGRARSGGWERVGGYQGKVYSGESVADAVQPHAGLSSLRLRNTESGQVAQVARNLDVGGSLEAGAGYELSAWLRSEGLKNHNGLSIGAFGAGFRSLGSWHIPAPYPAGGWAQGRVRFRVPAGTETVRFMLNLYGPGTVWFDDVRLDRVTADGTLAEVMHTGRTPLHGFMQGWVGMFHGEGRPYLLLGRMLHPPRIECDTVELFDRPMPAVFHNAFESPDGSRATVFVNATPAERKVKWTRGKAEETFVLGPAEAKLIREAAR